MSKVFKSSNRRQLEPNGYNGGTKDIRLEKKQKKQSEFLKLFHCLRFHKKEVPSSAKSTNFMELLTAYFLDPNLRSNIRKV